MEVCYVLTSLALISGLIIMPIAMGAFDGNYGNPTPQETGEKAAPEIERLTSGFRSFSFREGKENGAVYALLLGVRGSTEITPALLVIKMRITKDGAITHDRQIYHAPKLKEEMVEVPIRDRDHNQKIEGYAQLTLTAGTWLKPDLKADIAIEIEELK